MSSKYITRTVVVQQNVPEDQPQSMSLLPATFLFIVGGMDLAMSVGWSQGTYRRELLYSWFIGVAVGAIIASMFVTVLMQRIFVLISTLLVTASAIIFIAAPFEMKALLAARYISGFGIGFLIVPFIMHTSEISTERTRGMFLSFEQYGFALGILIQVYFDALYTGLLSENFSLHRIHGILALCFAFFSFVSIMAIKESPVFYLRKGDDAQAAESLRRLRRLAKFRTPVFETQVQDRLIILKEYMAENEQDNVCTSYRKGLLPLMKMMLYRGLLAFTFALPLNIALELGTLIAIKTDYINWPALVYAALRLIGTICSMIVVKNLCIKVMSLFSLLVMAGFAIGVGAIFSDNSNVADAHQMLIVCILMMIYQFFAGLFAPTTTVYLGEAFPLQVKPYFIAICVCVEQVVHIIVIVTFKLGILSNATLILATYSLYEFSLVVGVIMFGLFLVFCITMPETRGITMLEAQKRFRQLFHWQCY